jgi:hypothetical protein
MRDTTAKIPQELQSDLLSWAKEVEYTAYSDITAMDSYLMDSTTPGALSLCSSAFTSKWSNSRGNAFPFDDRQYYYPIMNFLSQKILYQANGMK